MAARRLAVAAVAALGAARRKEQAAAAEGTKAEARVLGLGSAGVDYVALVDAFPSPDDKVRVRSAFQSGGGNVANTLTALSRLGVATELLTKIGQDENGSAVLSELTSDGVGTSLVLRSRDTSTAWTYVIVDKETKTRTCIHTPQQQELTPLDVGQSRAAHDLAQGRYSLVHLDSRHTHAALELARLANSLAVPVSIDAEKNRPPFFDELLPLCNIIFTNERFPHIYPAAANPGRDDDKISQLFQTTRAEIIVTSLGANGSVLYLRRKAANSAELGAGAGGGAGGGAGAGAGGEEESAAAALAICRAPIPQLRVTRETRGDYDVLNCPAWPLAEEQVVDTTGAGDAFIGGFLAGHIHRLPPEKCLQLGTLCAANKIMQPGSRRGLPTARDMQLLITTTTTTTAPAP